MSEISNYYEHGPINDEKPGSIVFLLHGLGSNGQDLISLAPMFAQDLRNTLFVSPDAPFACDMVPPGYPNAYQWFSLQSREPEAVLEGVQTAAPILERFMAETAEKHNIPYERMVLCGFSQGCMMSLYTGLSFSEKLAGVLGYSGALAFDPAKGFDAYQKLPICLIHGESDDVVPFSSYRYARKTLMAHGYDVAGHSTPHLAHSIDEQGIAAGLDFLKICLS